MNFIETLPLPERDEVKRAGIFLGVVMLAFLVTRLIALTIIPIFTDEAIYLRWAQIALRDPELRFISLTDGKQPLFIWFAMVAMQFIRDPLVAGRLVSVLAGVAGVPFVWMLARELYGRRTSYLVSVVYLVVPITFVYSRMALMEMLLFTLGIASVLLTVLLAKHRRLDLALLLGGTLGLALLTKSSGRFYLFLVPLSAVFLPWQVKKDRAKKLAVWFVLILLAAGISQAAKSIMRLSPWYHMINVKNETFIVTFSEFFKEPTKWLFGNLTAFRHWVTGYMTLPLLAMASVGLVSDRRKYRREHLLLLGYFFGPLIASAAFGKVIYARYLMFFIFPLVILAGRGLAVLAEGIQDRWNRSPWLSGAAVLVLLVPALRIDYFLLTDPVRASIPANDKNQYIDDWPAGYGVNSVVEFIRGQAEDGTVTLATEGTFGLMPFSFELYLVDNPNVEIISFWPVEDIPDRVLERAQERPTYFVFNETQNIPDNLPIRLIDEYQKGSGESYLRLFEVLPSDSDAR